ncbi:MAG TPA: hypothetical protein VHD62_19170 [Opitutaceae bacterium]|nr:hypothetical protein [Opitutaceae bacterium]
MQRAASSFSASPAAAATRQLKILVLVLVASNIGLGIFSFYLLRRLDRSYSELIERSVPLLNDLQTLTARSVDAMRVTGTGLLEADATARPAAVQRARKVLENERAFREKILHRNWLPESLTGQRESEKTGTAFTGLALEVVATAATGDREAATRLRDTKLRPAFEDYQAALTHAADLLEAESMRANDDFSARTSSMSTMVLGLGGWPVIVLVGLIAITVIFVAVLMFLFRGSGMHEAP